MGAAYDLAVQESQQQVTEAMYTALYGNAAWNFFEKGDHGCAWGDPPAAQIGYQPGEWVVCPVSFTRRRSTAGDFCVEDRYADWAEEFREQARSCYVAVERALAQHHAAAVDHEAAVRHLHRLLTCEPYDEQAHLMLVRELDSAGRHGDARRMYRSYVARMAELDLEPAPYPEPVAGGA